MGIQYTWICWWWIIGLAYAPICLTGMHHSFIAIETQLIAAKAQQVEVSFSQQQV